MCKGVDGGGIGLGFRESNKWKDWEHWLLTPAHISSLSHRRTCGKAPPPLQFAAARHGNEPSDLRPAPHAAR